VENSTSGAFGLSGGLPWRIRFKEKVAFSDQLTLKDALTTLVETRNTFAHGGLEGLAISDTITFFNRGCEVLRILDETVHEEVE
jgi:hypothetical protein